MVLYKVEDSYYNDILKGMHNLRDSLYDLTLKIGGEKLHAHKTVFVTGSGYFKSLFVGPFVDKDKSEIDLSDLTDNRDILESVITFLYFGEIEINETNIEVLMKLSSFLMITKLQGFCSCYIEENLSLESCLKFYFLALHYGFPDLERKIGNIFQSRFHDFIIFHENAISSSPSEVSHLLKKDFLKFCRTSDLLDFLLQWIDTVKSKELQLTDEHLAIICQFMDYVATTDMDRSERKDCEKQFQDLRKVVVDELEMDSDLAKTFLHKIETELSYFKAKPEIATRNARKSKTDCLKKLKSRSVETKSKHQNEPIVQEDVIILICPKKYLLSKRDPSENLLYHLLQYTPISRSFEEPILDVLAYVPKQKTWYYINLMYDRSIMSDLLRDTGDSGFTQVGDQIFHLHEDDSDPISFYLNDSYSRRTWYCDQHRHSENDPAFDCHCDKSGLVVVNGCVYVVHKLSVYNRADHMENDDYDYEYRFCCCKLLPNGTWKIVFKTDKFPLNLSVYNDDARIFVSYTNVSKEMIIVFYCNNLISCYIVDLFARGGPKPLKVLPVEGMDLPTPDKDKKWWEAKIIEGTDRFYILEVEYAYKDEPTGKPEQRAVLCTHEYVYGSHVLTPSNSAKINLDYKVVDFKKSQSLGMFVECEYISPDSKSVWVFDGNKKDVSSLQEIVVEDGQLKVCSHIPPPNCYVAAMFPAKLSPDYLAGKRPIRKYMLAEDEEPTV